MIRSHVASSDSRKGCILSQPALFTTTSSWPHWASSSAIPRSTSARRGRATPSASALTPSRSASRRTTSAASRSMSSTATCAPSRASASTMARPIPRPPPVTSAVCPLSFTAFLLAVLPHGRALLHEGAEPLGRVLGRHQLVLVEGLERREPLVERKAERVAHGALGQAQDHGALGGEALELGVHGLGQPLGGHHAVGEADPRRLGGVDHRPRQQQP